LTGGSKRKVLAAVEKQQRSSRKPSRKNQRRWTENQDQNLLLRENQHEHQETKREKKTK
jgi:hypothetical protein